MNNATKPCRDRYYYVTCDRQGGSFGMGRLYTAYQWLEQAVEWHDHDDFWESDIERQNFIEQWSFEITNGNEDDFMEYVSDLWELDFEQGDPENGIPEEYDIW